MTKAFDTPDQLLEDINRLHQQFPTWDPDNCVSYCAVVRRIRREIPELQRRESSLTKQGYRRQSLQLMADISEGILELMYSCDAGFMLCEPGNPAQEEINELIIANCDRFDDEIAIDRERA